MNEVYPQSVSAVKKDLYEGSRQSFHKNIWRKPNSYYFLMNNWIDEVYLTSWKDRVIANVCIGLTLGSTANAVSPTSPLDVEATPDALIKKPPPNSLTSVGNWSQFNWYQECDQNK